MGKRSGWPVIEKQEMEVFCLLDQSGLSFQQNIELSFKQSQKIQDLLNQGIPFYKIVSRQKGSEEDGVEFGTRVLLGVFQETHNG